MSKNFVFDVDYVRAQFPALSKSVNGYPEAYLDGPGGTQVPKRVADKVCEYMFYQNANHGGAYRTSQTSDALIEECREVFAQFFNCNPDEVSFGENTSSNNFKLAFAFARMFRPGDEILITDIDHEGNRSPWRLLEQLGMVVKSVKINEETITLDFEDFKSKLSDRTKIFAINWAANSCGTVSDVKKFIAEAHKYGAITIVDAVHYAPHKVIDVRDIDTDILQCSAYKYFGPHLGVTYCKKEIGEKINTTRVQAYDNADMPYRLETGTLAMELVSGAAEAVRFIADIGARHMDQIEDEVSGLTGLRKEIVAGIRAIEYYEDSLADALRAGLSEIEGLKIYGPGEGAPRTPTVSFRIDGINANDIAVRLGEYGIDTWDGDYYAIRTIREVLDLVPVGGLLRIGFAPYNLMSEVDRVIRVVTDLVNERRNK